MAPPPHSVRSPSLRGHSAEGVPSTEPRSPLRPSKLGEDLSDFQAGCNRKVQLTKRGWNRFDAARRKVFLKWFAATANVAESARRAGVGKSTVSDHRMKDARFAEAWDRALDQGYARLEAKMLEMQWEQAAGGPIDFDGSFEPPDAPLVDLAMALQILKQHKAEVTRIRGERALRLAQDERGSSGRRRKKIPTYDRERLASDAEMRRALVKSLKAFGVRVSAEDLKGGAVGPSTIPSSRNGPPPSAGKLGEE